MVLVTYKLAKEAQRLTSMDHPCLCQPNRHRNRHRHAMPSPRWVQFHLQNRSRRGRSTRKPTRRPREAAHRKTHLEQLRTRIRLLLHRTRLLYTDHVAEMNNVNECTKNFNLSCFSDQLVTCASCRDRIMHSLERLDHGKTKCDQTRITKQQCLSKNMICLKIGCHCRSLNLYS